MIDPLWLRRGLWSAGVLCLVAAGWYGWFHVDWYDYFPAKPPAHVGDVVTDPYTELVGLRVAGVDPREAQPRRMAGDSIDFSGALKLDPQYWVVPLTQGESIALSELPRHEQQRIRAEHAKKVRPRVYMRLICQSWLEPGEKEVQDLVGTMNRSGPEEVSWWTSWTLRRPGVYLVRVNVAEWDPLPGMSKGYPKSWNERTLTTFLLTVDPYVPKEG
ncbi:MAG: hypothetical protein AB7I48_17610 [Planctomycetaceae bacterium]